MTKKIDVNDMGPAARRALLNFVGGFIDLNLVLLTYGASPEEIRIGAIEAIDNIMKTDSKKKARVLKAFNASRNEDLIGSDE